VRAAPILLLCACMLVGCGATEAPASASTREPTEAAAVATRAEVPAGTATPSDAPELTEPPSPAAEEPIEAEPFVLRAGGMLDADCWNPSTCAAPHMWGRLVMEGLTDEGPASEGCPGVPSVAESWELSEDGLTWTVHLHEGVTFSDGTRVTADTIKELLQWLSSDESLAIFDSVTVYLDSVEVLDVLTLQYTTVGPAGASSGVRPHTVALAEAPKGLLAAVATLVTESQALPEPRPSRAT
jgi:ABC-type transport system substrate-binding protein